MTILIVFDSYFGNTEKIAMAMMDVLKADHSVSTVHVEKVAEELLSEVDLVIIGSPTRYFKATKAIVNFIKGIHYKTYSDIRFAVFDTRMEFSHSQTRVMSLFKWGNKVASVMMKVLIEQKGGIVISDAKAFFTDDLEGPLRSGEIVEAKRWVNEVVSQKI